MGTIQDAILPNIPAAAGRALVFENDATRIVLLPEKGSEIFAVESRKHNVDVLWKSPWGFRPPAISSGTSNNAEAIWLDHYAGGWQELFPNAGDACFYRGADLTFHGEASVAPWRHEIAVGSNGEEEARLELRLARSPFRLEKRVSLDPVLPILRLWERVTNDGSDRMPYMWGHHPAYGAPFLAEGCRLQVPAATYEADLVQAPRTWLDPGKRSTWPVVDRVGGGTVDLSAVPGPEARVANLGYLLDLREGWYALANPSIGLGVGVVWPLDVFPCIWLWQEFQGTQDYPWYGSIYVMGVEPHSSHPGHGLLKALDHGTARWLEPGEQQTMELRMVLFDGARNVRRITPEGHVEFA
jgi:hypothetical protein